MKLSDQSSLARIDIGSLSLILPHRNISTVELVSSIKYGSLSNAPTLTVLGARWPVISFSPQLALEKIIPTTQRFIACVNPSNTTWRFAISCEKVDSIQYTPEELKQLPPLMSSPDTPILGVLYKDKVLHCVTNADHLANFLNDEFRLFETTEVSIC
ncbi:hypothetical protein A9Q99_17810 [Gammaproteobacteria bacterium 45_16_T64]|nr:hypothetical protein A9Q99_17810 [Gammaproteobacteria bacterium 45_16_T64]